MQCWVSVVVHEREGGSMPWPDHTRLPALTCRRHWPARRCAAAWLAPPGPPPPAGSSPRYCRAAGSGAGCARWPGAGSRSPAGGQAGGGQQAASAGSATRQAGAVHHTWPQPQVCPMRSHGTASRRTWPMGSSSAGAPSIFCRLLATGMVPPAGTAAGEVVGGGWWSSGGWLDGRCASVG